MAIPFTGQLLEGEEIKLYRHHIKEYAGTRYTGARESTYYVTSYGRVARQNKYRKYSKTDACKWLKITPSTHPCGYYYQVRFPWGTSNIHRLVGKLFLPDFSDDLMVCHRRETLPAEHINRVVNLFMGTHSDNMIDAHRKGRKQWSNQYGCATS